MIVYIDGFTRIPYQTLRQLICDNGGRFEPALYNVKITHFVAENLSYAKLEELYVISIIHFVLTFNLKLHVVKPEWITDSLKNGKRMNESLYSLMRSDSGIESTFTKFVFNKSLFKEARRVFVDP